MPTRKGAGKKSKATKGRASRHTMSGRSTTESLLRKAVKKLQKAPGKYQKLRRALKAARTDKEREGLLLLFATSTRQLKAMALPSSSPPRCATTSVIKEN